MDETRIYFYKDLGDGYFICTDDTYETYPTIRADSA